MSNLEDRLRALSATGTQDTETDRSTVAADLDRAQGAWRHRRTRRAQALSLGTLATFGVVAAVAVGVDARNDSEPAAAPPATTTSTPPGSATPTTPATTAPTRPATPLGTEPARGGDDIRLVSYSGPQTAGFDVTSIPDGFVLQGADNVSLALARPDNRTPIFDFKHKIVVTVELVATHGPLDPQLNPIEVQGKPGTIVTKRDGTITLYYQLDDERLAYVQAWNDVGISEERLVEFAESLTIADDVETVS